MTCVKGICTRCFAISGSQGPATLSPVPGNCHICVCPESASCPATVRPYPATLSSASGNCQTRVCPASDPCLAILWPLSAQCMSGISPVPSHRQASARPSPDSCPVTISHPQAGALSFSGRRTVLSQVPWRYPAIYFW